MVGVLFAGHGSDVPGIHLMHVRPNVRISELALVLGATLGAAFEAPRNHRSRSRMKPFEAVPSVNAPFERSHPAVKGS